MLTLSFSLIFFSTIALEFGHMEIGNCCFTVSCIDMKIKRPTIFYKKRSLLYLDNHEHLSPFYLHFFLPFSLFSLNFMAQRAFDGLTVIPHSLSLCQSFQLLGRNTNISCSKTNLHNFFTRDQDQIKNPTRKKNARSSSSSPHLVARERSGL